MDQQVFQLHLSIFLAACLSTDELTNCGAVFNDRPAPLHLLLHVSVFHLAFTFFNPKITLPLLINIGKV